jgi:hypothetical protein
VGGPSQHFLQFVELHARTDLPPSNAEIAELFSREASEASYVLQRAYRPAARSAFLWEVEARELVARSCSRRGFEGKNSARTDRELYAVKGTPRLGREGATRRSSPRAQEEEGITFCRRLSLGRQELQHIFISRGRHFLMPRYGKTRARTILPHLPRLASAN